MKQLVQFTGCLGIACLLVCLAHLAIEHSDQQRSAANSKQRMELRIDLPIDPNSVNEFEVAAQNHNRAQPVIHATPVEEDSDSEFKRQLKALDSFKANSIASTHFNKSEWELAAEWYLSALDCDPMNKQAAQGLVMSIFEAGKYQHAYQSSIEYSKTFPGIKHLLIKSAADEVHKLLEAKQYDAADALLNQFPDTEMALSSSRVLLSSLMKKPKPANNTLQYDQPDQKSDTNSSSVELGGYYTTRSWDIGNNKDRSSESIPREAYLIRGWSLFHVGEYEDAAQVFEKLYKTQADVESARGIVASLRAGGDLARLNRMVNDWGGILATESSAGSPSKQDQIY